MIRIHFVIKAIALTTSLLLLCIHLYATISIQNNQGCLCQGEPHQPFTVIAEGTAGPFTFLWTGPNGYTSEVQNPSDIVEIGEYTVTVTNAYSCEIVLSTSIVSCGDPIQLQETIESSCVAGMNGSIQLSVLGGEAPYTFNWVTGATTQNLSDLNPGFYQVTVTDANGCLEVASYEVPTDNNITLTANGNQTTCEGGTDGSVVAAVSGAGPDISFQWSNGATSRIVDNLEAGLYSVTVTGPGGCQAVADALVTEGDGYTLNATFEEITCLEGPVGAIDLNIIGHNPLYLDYTYEWTSPDYPNFSASTKDINNVEAGTYCVSITDDAGCEASGCWDIEKIIDWPYVQEVQVHIGSNPDLIIYRATWEEIEEGCLIYVKDVNYSVTDEALQELTNSQELVVDIITNVDMQEVALVFPDANNIIGYSTPGSSGDAWSFNVTWLSNFIDDEFEQQLLITGLDVNNNTLLSLGNNGLNHCVDIPELDDNCNWTPAPIIGEDLSHVIGPCVIVDLVINENATTLEAQIQGVAYPYTGYDFIWYKDGDNLGESPTIGYGDPGEYCVKIVSADGCARKECVTICDGLADIDVLVQEPVCPGDPAPYVCILPANGASFDDARVTLDFGNGMVYENVDCIENLAEGSYALTINIEYESCETITRTASFQIDQASPPPLVVTGTSNSVVDCPWTLEPEGQICIDVQGGNPPYTYEWSTGSSGECLTNVYGSYFGEITYSVIITDQCGSSIMAEDIVVPIANQLLHTIQSIQHATCEALGRVEIVFAGEGGFTVEWENLTTGATDQFTTSAGLVVLDDLTGGDYIVNVRTPCSQNTPVEFTIDGPLQPNVPFEIIEDNVMPHCGDFEGGAIEISINGTAHSPYSFQWSNGETTEDINNLEQGTYCVTVTNSVGCQELKCFDILFTNLFIKAV